MNKIRAFVRIILFALWSIPLVLMQMVVLMVTRGPAAYKIPRLWHRGLCAIFGMRVIVRGRPLNPHAVPVMFISNHISYLDILVMGSVLEASFVAKLDVAKWPIFGFLSQLQQTAFISRASKDALRERYSLQSYLKARKSIILFPEGTTDNGREVLPFKSSLFALALDHHLTDGALRVQPFSLRVCPLNQTPAALQAANDYDWPFDDMTPMPIHLIQFAGGPGCILELIFHAPIDPKFYDDRKVLCEDVRNVIVRGHTDGMVQNAPTAPSSQPEPIS